MATIQTELGPSIQLSQQCTEMPKEWVSAAAITLMIGEVPHTEPIRVRPGDECVRFLWIRSYFYYHSLQCVPRGSQRKE